MKNKKLRPTALFLLVISTTLLLAGCGAWFVYRNYVDQPKAPVNYAALSDNMVFQPETDHNQTILWIIDAGGTADTDILFLISRFLPVDKKLYFLPLSGKTACHVNTSKNSLAGFYRQGGSLTARQAAENAVNQTIDRYVQMDADGFTQFVERLGGLTYKVPHAIDWEHPDTGERYRLRAGLQNLDGIRLRQILTYPHYSAEPAGSADASDSLTASAANDGDLYRTILLGMTVTECINQNLDQSLKSRLETLFLFIVNNMDTNISRKDYNFREQAVYWCMENNPSPSACVPPKGAWDEDGQYRLTVDFRKMLANMFQATPLTEI